MSLAELFYARRLLRRLEILRPRPASKARPRRRKLVFEPLEGRLLLSAESTILALPPFDPTPSLEPPAVVSPLVVSSFAPTESGVTARFNRPLDRSVLSLYDAETVRLGPADATLVGAARGPVSGSVVVDAGAEGITFIRTGGPLEPDTYTVTLRSAVTGFKDASGGLLDGNADGTMGDDFVGTFTIADATIGGSAPRVVSVADFARGPGQLVDLTAGKVFPRPEEPFPIRLSDGAGVERVDLTLRYDPDRLTITAVEPGFDLPDGSRVQADRAVSGVVILGVTFPAPLGPGPVDLVTLAAHVPGTAPYGSAQILDVTQVAVSANVSGPAPIADDGLHVVAYFGDTTGNGRYSSLDGQRVLRVAVSLDSGFAAYPLIDLVVVGDTSGNGAISALDATRILQEVVGQDRGEIPPILPVIIAALARDTGPDATDRLTSDPGIAGTVTDDGTVTAFRAGLDATPSSSFFDVFADLQPGGSFAFDRARLEQINGGVLSDGPHTLRLMAEDEAGNASPVIDVRFTLDTASALLSAALKSDTGTSATDRLTRDPTVAGTVTDAGGIASLKGGFGDTPLSGYVDLTDAVAADGQFTLGLSRLEGVFGNALSDGAYSLHLIATDRADNSTTVDLSFTLDTSAPQIGAFGLAASSDTGTAGDGITSAARVVLAGTAEAGARLTLAGQTALAGGGGAFQIPDVALADGVNALTLLASDVAGNSREANLTLTREGTVSTDVALTWNQQALEAIRLQVVDPPAAARILAMVSLAQYDTLNAIEGTPAYLIQRSVAGPVSVDAALARAAHTILSAFFPSQRTMLDAALAQSVSTVADGAAKESGLALGRAIGLGVLALRSNDGSTDFVDYPGSIQIGQWRPTGPMFDVADEPQWADVTPFALASPDQFRPAPPPALESTAYAAAVEEVRSLGSATSSTRNAEQTEIAQFWADGKGSYTPPGHWNQIAQEIARAQGNSLTANVRLMAQLNVALADAAIVCWDSKYTYGLWRPETAINNAEADNNAGTTQESGWTPLLITPAHPEYVSGHSTFSAAAARILGATFGNDTAFSAAAFTLPGVTRSFPGFTQAAQEAGRSRIYGGIHYEFTNQAGQQLGRQVADVVLARFTLSQDVQAPVVVAQDTAAVTNTNLTLTGQMFDNLAGVAASQYRIDNGELQTLVLDADGRFSITTAFALDGSDDGSHAIAIQARDAAGNVASAFTRSFTLDTRAPTLSLTSLADGASLDTASRLTGTADPTGSTLTELKYGLDGGTSRNLIYDSVTGAFDQALIVGNLSIGDHALTLTARDAAGNVSTLTRNVTLAALTPFTVTRVTPADGAGDVGSTFRPQVYFSRAVDPATLTSDTFYATGPDGQKLAATIVPAVDGSFAWLFSASPMPGGANITVHVNGSSIRAQADGAVLDADGDGAAGGEFTWSFTTVSRTIVAGTKLVGRVVDPGPDLEPMTFDDIRRGPDGVIHTPDDVFLNPIEHAKVFILGREDMVVFTDATGLFELTDVPVGTVKIAIDGRTATNAPAGVFFPEMVMDAELRAGVTNTVMGSMGSTEERLANVGRREVYLPRVATSILQNVSSTEVTTITVDDISAPQLSDEQRSRLTLGVQPGSLVGEDGRPLGNAQLGISTVPPELVRDMLPPGVLQHTFDITIQAPGVATFADPVQITFPNVFDAAPGTKLSVLSFDHTTGRLVINGTATVSADGTTVTSDPDSGVLAPGWHGLTPPNNCCGTDGSAPPRPPRPTPLDTRRERDSVALPMIVGQTGSLATLSWTAPDKLPDTPPPPPPPPDSECPIPSEPLDPPGKKQPYLKVTIEVDGPLADFMKKSGNLELSNQSFVLTAGSAQTKTFGGTAKTYKEMFGEDGFRIQRRDRLYGAKVKITEEHGRPDGSRHTEVYTQYVYRWVTVVDALKAKDKEGDTAAFLKTFVDGAGGFVREKEVDVNLPMTVTTNAEAAKPLIVNDPRSGAGTMTWKFDPEVEGDLTDAKIKLKVNDPTLGNGGEVGQLTPVAKGVGKTKLSLNLDMYKEELMRVLLSLQDVLESGFDHEPGKKDVDDDQDGVTDNDFEYGFPGTDDEVSTRYTFPNHTSFVKIKTPGADGRAGVAGIDDDKNGKIDDAGDYGVAGSDDVVKLIREPAIFGTDYIDVSPRFKELFGGFMPRDRKAGADRVQGTADDAFDAEQLNALHARIDKEAGDLLAEVTNDFSFIIDALTLQPTNDGADVFAFWFDLGSNFAGEADRQMNDRDEAKMYQVIGTHKRKDPVTGNTFSAEIPEATQQWALAQFINLRKDSNSRFAVGLHADLSHETITFAQRVANTVSHEFGHTFGLNEGYFSEGEIEDGKGVRGGGGTAEIDENGNALPYDIMGKAFRDEGDQEFKDPRTDLLKAAVGLAPNGDLQLGFALTVWRDQWNLTHRYPDRGHDQDGFRIVGDTRQTTPQIQLSLAGREYLGLSEESVTLGTGAADGVGGLWQEATFDVTNFGAAPLVISDVGLALGTAGFSIVTQGLSGLTLNPSDMAAITVRFDPTVAGSLSDTMVIGTNAGLVPQFRLGLTGTGLVNAPVVSVLAPENNLGGVLAVGAQAVDRPAFATIRNDGAQPLAITSIRVVDGGDSFRVLGVSSDLSSHPLSLTTGETFSFGLGFDPLTEGLLRGVVEVTTNDPARPVTRVSAVGTGLAEIVYPQWGNDFFAVELADGRTAPPLRVTSDAAGKFSLSLPALAPYHVAGFDPVTALIAHGRGTVGPSGGGTNLVSSLVFAASTTRDSDFDGLPDDIEFAIGTSTLLGDSDRDGLSDFTEIQQGLDPLGGLGIPIGIVAASRLQGSAQAVVVAGSVDDPSRLTAYVATGS